jgi:hypothetical protein
LSAEERISQLVDALERVVEVGMKGHPGMVIASPPSPLERATATMLVAIEKAALTIIVDLSPMGGVES